MFYIEILGMESKYSKWTPKNAYLGPEGRSEVRWSCERLLLAFDYIREEKFQEAKKVVDEVLQGRVEVHELANKVLLFVNDLENVAKNNPDNLYEELIKVCDKYEELSCKSDFNRKAEKIKFDAYVENLYTHIDAEFEHIDSLISNRKYETANNHIIFLTKKLFKYQGNCMISIRDYYDEVKDYQKKIESYIKKSEKKLMECNPSFLKQKIADKIKRAMVKEEFDKVIYEYSLMEIESDEIEKLLDLCSQLKEIKQSTLPNDIKKSFYVDICEDEGFNDLSEKFKKINIEKCNKKKG
ncbi:MAG: hypothetical protein E7184_00930 [Erysipelotrichaceae bacterium]|nr:hypothetical protein [Erysipelotrichaceae bacterium]